MSWIVTIGGLIIIAAIAWFFWGPRRGGSLAQTDASGYQEAHILVKNGYNPSRIVVQSGKPVRFEFTRVETGACDGMVVFPDFEKSATLPAGKKVIVELPAMKPGSYNFSCQMGMFKGKIIAKN